MNTRLTGLRAALAIPLICIGITACETDATHNVPDGAIATQTDMSHIISLAEINATQCGAIDAPRTLTISQQAGAEDPVTGGMEVVNASAAALFSYPGIVKLEPRQDLGDGRIARGHCGATRIANNWFVTAAHCIDERYDELTLITGSATLGAVNAFTVTADYAICHGAYQGRPSNFANDVALVKINDDDARSLRTVPIANYGATDKALTPANYEKADMAGWGLTAFGGTLSENLLEAELAVSRIGPASIEIRSQNGTGPCIGDSGGPLYVTEDNGRKVVVGVLSVVQSNSETGGFCEGDYAGRYTNLQGFDDWIEQVTATCEQKSELCE